MTLLTRRRFLGTAAAGALSALWVVSSRKPVYAQTLGATPDPQDVPPVSLTLTPAERPTALPAFGGATLPMWTFSDDDWLPIVRIPLGTRLEVDLHNQLPRDGEQASIHWHGIRVPNDQDGVPYLVQDPVFPGDSYHYSFAPPDTGTYFFHTHCNTSEHLGRGLMGILIVEGDETEPYDADEVVMIRDWRVDLSTGTFLPFTTHDGASAEGTFGTVRSVNGATDPEIALPAAADCRLRLMNLDPTRIVQLGIDGADAVIVAIDGVAIEPAPLDQWVLGPAMRCDVIVRTPSDGGVVRLFDYYNVDPAVELATFRASGADVRTTAFNPAPLRAGRIAEPDLDAADIVPIDFDAARPGDDAPTDAGAGYLGILCLSTDQFWTINFTGWPGGDHSAIPNPIAEFELGKTYRILMRNHSDVAHPIHIHGHTMMVLDPDPLQLPNHHADTVMLLPHGALQVAFVANNPGKWMIHCHIAEHQDTGMMGYFTVT